VTDFGARRHCSSIGTATATFLTLATRPSATPGHLLKCRFLWRSRNGGAWHDSCVELVAAATLYGLFSAWLLFPLFGVRRMLRTSTAALMWLEFLAVLTWGYTKEDCARGSCSPLAEAARTAVAVDLPALSIAVVALAVAHAVLQQRGSPRPNRARGEFCIRLPFKRPGPSTALRDKLHRCLSEDGTGRNRAGDPRRS